MNIIRLIASFYVSITISVRGEISTPIMNDYFEMDNEGRRMVVSRPIVEECKTNETCVRFCCREITACLDLDFFDLRSMKEARRLKKTAYKVLRGKPNCTDMYIEDKAPWEFIEDGSVVQYIEQSNYTNHHDTYCLDKNDTKAFMMICHGDYDYDIVSGQVGQLKASYPFLMLISVPFLLITFLVYSCINELRNLHGKCLMSYLAGLISLYLSLSLIQLNHERIHEFAWLCTGVGYIAFFSVLICFSWLNTMCYDIYNTFKGIQRLLTHRRGFDTKRSESKKFIAYCLYAFGGPALIVFLVYVSDNTNFIPEEIKIRMGQDRCWIKQSQLIEFLYIYIPISCILVLNTTFYAITAFKINQVWKETLIIRQADSRRHSEINLEKTRFFLYLRLFIVMGVTWSIEIVSWAVQDSLILHIVDILNCLQGIVIFILFVWKPKIKKLIFRRVSTFRQTNSLTSTSKLRKLSRTESSVVSTQTTNASTIKLVPIVSQTA